ncbi:unnamed protein product [Caenorhabditis bovis]|uniref:Uncharacterized protein n=1 Tax=Caenorhabditis bovis TaxID=2654633 RepID=A0A8S1EES3_9PELO|nr:unnamed protein product [Caenorhabditis bovis]
MTIGKQQRGTSVRERVAAIEKNEQVPDATFLENTVIRARYAPDVRGVNRYRHFHMPNVMNDVNSNNFPKDSNHLPFLIRPGQVHYIDPNDRDAANGMEKGIRKKKKNVTLPQLSPTPIKPTVNKRDIVDHIENRARVAIRTNSPEKTSSESDNSVKSNYSGVRFNDRLTSTTQEKPKTTAVRRTFASLGQRQNGVIINGPQKNSLEVALPPRSKSAQDIEARMEPDFAPPDTTFYNIIAAPSLRDFRDMATQTSKHMTTSSVEYLNCGRGTQTEAVPLIIVPRRKSEAPINIRDLEEREALMEVIEDAFSETFDRYTRVRTNQIIANSAKKQGQILRDAKDFLANTLIPQAVILANKSTSKPKTAAEIVANIKIFP